MGLKMAPETGAKYEQKTPPEPFTGTQGPSAPIGREMTLDMNTWYVRTTAETHE